MSTALFLLFGSCCLIAGYFFYGKFIARLVGLRPDRPTPAHAQADGVDFVPASRSVLFGHHFASIAGAGPIIGPIVACQFGWLPAMLWVLLGGIFIGAVHDFTSLLASIRHGGQSLGTVLEKYVGRDGRLLLMIFKLLALILVIGVFTEAVTGVLNADVTEAAKAAQAATVTSTSVAFLVCAVFFGLVVQPRPWPQWSKTLLAIGLLVGALFIGQTFPLAVAGSIWPWILMGYITLAAITPVNILLQPRDFLSSFLLLFLLFGGIAGAVIGNSSFSASAADIAWQAPVLGGNLPAVGLFPFLFIVVACGAISGFHSVVAAGTTARQLDSEKDALPVGFGSMLLECLLALLAIAAVMTLSTEPANGPVMAQFIQGMSNFFATLGFDPSWAASLVALTVSAFLLTSLDTCTRLARYTLQELLPTKAGWLRSALATTLLVAGAGVALSLIKGGTAETPISAAKMLWPIFGASNQLLASLALLAVSVWLSRPRKIAYYTFIPMLVMLITTLTGLAWHGYLMWQTEKFMLALLDGLLIALALVMAVRTLPRIIRPRLINDSLNTTHLEASP